MLELRGSNGAVLRGTKVKTAKKGTLTYTDLSFSQPGEFSIYFRSARSNDQIMDAAADAAAADHHRFHQQGGQQRRQTAADAARSASAFSLDRHRLRATSVRFVVTKPKQEARCEAVHTMLLSSLDEELSSWLSSSPTEGRRSRRSSKSMVLLFAPNNWWAQATLLSEHCLRALAAVGLGVIGVEKHALALAAAAKAKQKGKKKGKKRGKKKGEEDEENEDQWKRKAVKSEWQENQAEEKARAKAMRESIHHGGSGGGIGQYGTYGIAGVASALTDVKGRLWIGGRAAGWRLLTGVGLPTRSTPYWERIGFTIADVRRLAVAEASESRTRVTEAKMEAQQKERERRGRERKKRKAARKVAGDDDEDEDEEEDSNHVASSRELTRRYYEHSLEWHPDRWAGDGVPEKLQKRAAGVFALVSEAHKFLKKYVAEQAEAPCTATNPYCPQQEQEEEEDGGSGFSYVQQLAGGDGSDRAARGGSRHAADSGDGDVQQADEEIITRMECTGPGASSGTTKVAGSKQKKARSAGAGSGAGTEAGSGCRILKTKVKSNAVGLRTEKRGGSWGWGGKKVIQTKGKEPEKLTALRAFMGFNVQRPKLLHPADRFETEEAMQEYYSTHLP
jgi:hypothetical protein